MYTTTNFKTKKALREAVDAWNAYAQLSLDDLIMVPASKAPDAVTIYAPGMGTPVRDGIEYLEGPHYPAPHSWYAKVTMRDGVVVKVHK